MRRGGTRVRRLSGFDVGKDQPLHGGDCKSGGMFPLGLGHRVHYCIMSWRYRGPVAWSAWGGGGRRQRGLVEQLSPAHGLRIAYTSLITESTPSCATCQGAIGVVSHTPQCDSGALRPAVG